MENPDEAILPVTAGQPFTAAELIELLSKCPPDRRVHILDDSMERGANLFDPAYASMEDGGRVILISWEFIRERG